MDISVKALQILAGTAALFTLLWFVLYGRRPSAAPGRAERLLARGWLVFRRVSCFSIAAFFTLVAIGMAFMSVNTPLSSRIGPILFCLLIVGMASWVGLYGAGRLRSMSDDRATHQQRKKRYGWRW